MLYTEDNYKYHEESESLEFAVLSVIGDREEQQDCAGFILRDKEAIAVVCDGMGGQDSGQAASRLACGLFLTEYENEQTGSDIHSFLLDTASEADNSISEMRSDAGELLQAGSTVTAVCVRDDTLFWLSVGDSRIYICRENELVRATADHNYRYLLEAQLESGQIDETEYREKIVQGEALVSFLGVGGLPLIEANDIPFRVRSGDRILLTSDGLYKLVSDEGIKSALMEHDDIEEALNALELRAQASADNINRDNMTAVLIRIK